MVTTRVLKPQGVTMSSYVMINGKISLEEEATIPALDRGFLYGDAVYEIIASQNGVLIDFERHIQRLRNSCQLQGIVFPWANETLRFEMEHLLSSYPFPHGQIRLLVTRGIGGKLLPSSDLTPQHYIYYKEVAKPHYDESSQACRLKTKPNPLFSRDELIKTTHYLHAISQSLNVAKEGYDEVLWLGPDSEFTEAAFANIFFISREGDLVEIATPPLAAGILPGVTRLRIIELLTLAKIPVTERTVTMEELPRFDEAFLTSSIRRLRPVGSIDKHRLHTTRKNAVFWHIHRLYESWVLSELGKSGNRVHLEH